MNYEQSSEDANVREHIGDIDGYLKYSQVCDQSSRWKIDDSRDSIANDLKLSEYNITDHFADIIFAKNKAFIAITGITTQNQVRLIIKELCSKPLSTSDTVLDQVITSRCSALDSRCKMFKQFKNHIYYFVITSEREA